MARLPTSVKNYVVPQSDEERAQLEELIGKGKGLAPRLLKGADLLKADVSELSEGWSDSRIIKALDASASMVNRVRRQLLEEGVEAVLSRMQRAMPAVAPIFDDEKEARLIALAYSKPPRGQARVSFFRKVATSGRVHCLFDFENRRGALRHPSVLRMPSLKKS